MWFSRKERVYWKYNLDYLSRKPFKGQSGGFPNPPTKRRRKKEASSHSHNYARFAFGIESKVNATWLNQKFRVMFFSLIALLASCCDLLASLFHQGRFYYSSGNSNMLRFKVLRAPKSCAAIISRGLNRRTHLAGCMIGPPPSFSFLPSSSKTLHHLWEEIPFLKIRFYRENC